jgi:hypothetical protein
MSFDLKNTPNEFQNIMNDILLPIQVSQLFILMTF